MPFLVGTDEAGYGPNLGPLVISASVWQVPDGVAGNDLYQLLSPAISSAATRGSSEAVAIADSKSLYQSGKGWRLLERGLWAAWGLLGHRPTTRGEVWDLLTGESCSPRKEALCGDHDAAAAPHDAHAAEIVALLPGLRQVLDRAGVRLLDLRSKVIFPRQFNEALRQYESKGAALSHWTLDLALRRIAPLGDEAIHVLCDKHGGRDRYLPLLMEFFPDVFIEIREEGRQQSRYRFGPSPRRVEFCFQAKGESHLPTALASMASKYLRELAMDAFNAHWRRHLPDLKPTAGYPVDARRFKTEIAAVQQSLGIPDRIVWREK